LEVFGGDSINEFGEIISRRNEANIKHKENYDKSKQNFLNEIISKIKKFFRHN
jgi:hypothetical protein